MQALPVQCLVRAEPAQDRDALFRGQADEQPHERACHAALQERGTFTLECRADLVAGHAELIGDLTQLALARA